MSSVLVRRPGSYRLYNKGAAEIVLQHCVGMVNAEGQVVPMTAELQDELLAMLTAMASRGLRMLCLSYRDFPLVDPGRPEDFFAMPHEEQLTALCFVGIKDPVRREVPAAVATCQRAGITVRMVTGDNIHTARHIARECGILTSGLAMEGPDFRRKAEEELFQLLPQLQVGVGEAAVLTLWPVGAGMRAFGVLWDWCLACVGGLRCPALSTSTALAVPLGLGSSWPALAAG